VRVALLEDDTDQANILSLWLQEAKHSVVHFTAGRELIRALRKESFDLLILDWLVPDTSGLDVLKWTRSNYDWNVPVLFITRLDKEEDVVRALEAGADDYMEKPVKHREILARIEALSRRKTLGQSSTQTLEFPPYTIDLASRSVQYHDKWLELTQKEYELAVFLFKNSGRALSRGHILDSVWGTAPDLNTRTVDTHVSRLRKKLEFNQQGSGWALSSIYQHGYRLEPQPGDLEVSNS
jgi:DNA-binding response OmpR family regulator